MDVIKYLYNNKYNNIIVNLLNKIIKIINKILKLRYYGLIIFK